MSAITIQQMADRVAGLMEERLRIKGRGLAEKLARGRGKLPRRVRASAQKLAEAAHMSQNPKLLLQVNDGEVAEAYDVCLKHLGPMGRADRRKTAVLSVVGNIVFSLVIAGALLLGLLMWRGYL